MFEKETVIPNPTGLHARPAAQLSALCKSYPNAITVSSGERITNPKSIFSLLSGCFKQGEAIVVRVDGEDGERVAGEIVAFIDALEG